MSYATATPTQTFGTPKVARKGNVLVSWITTTDHKTIGYLYLITSFIYFMIGGVLALVIRAELFTPGLDVVPSNEAYNQLFTMHGTIMLLMFATPLFAGFANVRDAAADRRARRRIPAVERPGLLAVLLRIAHRGLRILHPAGRGRLRLDGLRPADQHDVHARGRRQSLGVRPRDERVRHHPRRASTSSPRSSRCALPA